MNSRIILLHIARILVGIEFVFSGFVKVVDPYGTGLKLQEYFEVFALDLPALAPIFQTLANSAQGLSLLFCAGEFILGFALLASFRMKWTTIIVLGMMLFFTFLTFYSAYFNKVTDCGCFGDFLKLKPWHSFWKDIISLAFIFPIFFYRDVFKESYWSGTLVTLATLIGFGIGIYAFLYLPPLDFLPYAKGKSIPDQMAPTGVEPVFQYTFLDKSTQKTVESADYLADTSRYQYLNMETLNEADLAPKITDYSLGDTLGGDWTEASLQGNKLFIALKNTESISTGTWEKLKVLSKNAQKINDIDVWFISSEVPSKTARALAHEGIQSPVFTIDEKVLKTMARTNPCIIQLKDGVVIEKWSHRQIPLNINL